MQINFGTLLASLQANGIDPAHNMTASHTLVAWHENGVGTSSIDLLTLSSTNGLTIPPGTLVYVTGSWWIAVGRGNLGHHIIIDSADSAFLRAGTGFLSPSGIDSSLSTPLHEFLHVFIDKQGIPASGSGDDLIGYQLSQPFQTQGTLLEVLDLKVQENMATGQAKTDLQARLHAAVCAVKAKPGGTLALQKLGLDQTCP
jgi:hypothetical protein